MTTKYPDTPATRLQQKHHIAFGPLLYQYEDHGGTRVAADALNLPEHAVIKTLVMENEQARPLIILMHGDCDVAVKKLATEIGAKSVHPCKPDVAQKHTGYQVGGTSPFGLRKPIPIYLERTILDLPLVYINGGKRGFLLGMHAHDLMPLLSPTTVSVARHSED